MTLNLRAFLEDAGLEDFESKLKEVSGLDANGPTAQP